MLTRRDMLRMGVLTTVAGMGGWARASALLPQEVKEDWYGLFQEALREKPYLLGWKGVSQESFRDDEVTIEGKLPEALQGSLYRNGPAVHEIGTFRYKHWFDGDGMVQAYRFRDGRVTHQARVVQTTKHKAEKAAGRPLYPAFGTAVEDPNPVSMPDDVNVANISVLPFEDRLLALWEAGSPYELDPETLETRGVYSFSEDTAGAPFSAHPRIDADGSIWNFGYATGVGKILFWHLSAQGKLVSNGLVDVDPITMPHDFVVTEKYLVLLLAPFDYHGSGGGAFLDSFAWKPEQPTRILVVEKDDLTRHRWFELPPQWVFHYGNGWEDGNVIRFDGSPSKAPELMTDAFRTIMKGDGMVGAEALTHHNIFELDLASGKARQTPLLDSDWISEFPSIHPGFSTRRNRYTIALTGQPAALPGSRVVASTGLSRVSRLDMESGKTQTYSYAKDLQPEEHIVVPKPDSKGESDAWVLGTALDFRTKQTKLFVFEASDLAAGPLAVCSLHYPMPLGLHGKFVAK